VDRRASTDEPGSGRSPAAQDAEPGGIPAAREPEAPGRDVVEPDRLHEAIVRAMPAAVVVLDRSGRVLAANPEFHRSFGTTEATVPGEPLERVLPPGMVASGGVAELLASHFGDLGPLMQASQEEIEAVDGVGPTIAESVRRFFDEPRNREEVERLRSLGVRWTATPPRPTEGVLSGRTLVLTGGLEGLTRDDLTDLAAMARARRSTSP